MEKVTIITSYSNYQANVKFEEFKTNNEEFLSLPINMVIQCNNKYLDFIKIIRKDLESQTKYIENDFVKFNYIYLLNSILEENPFNSERFCWINFEASIINTYYSKVKFQEILTSFDINKYYLHLNYPMENKNNLIEYYSEKRKFINDNLIVCGRKVGLEITTELIKFIETEFKANFIYHDGMIYLHFLDKFNKEIKLGYGDLQDIFTNYLEIKENLHYIYYFIYLRFKNLKLYSRAYTVGKELLEYPSLHFKIASKLLTNFFELIYNNKKEIYLDNNDQYQKDIEFILNELEKRKLDREFNSDYYVENSGRQWDSQIKKLTEKQEIKERKHFDIIFCVFGCTSIEKYVQQIKKINSTWGLDLKEKNEEEKNRNRKKKYKLIYFLCQDQTVFSNDNSNDHIEYVNLKGVRDDGLSVVDKQNLGLKHIYENYLCNFIFVCGTDTFVNLNNLDKYLSTLDKTKSLFLGGHGGERVIYQNKSFKFHSGGGFVLSYACLDQIYDLLETMKDDWFKFCPDYLKIACDVCLAYYIQTEAVVEMIENKNFYGCNYLGIYKNQICCNVVNLDDIICCHEMSLEDFDQYYSIIKQ